MKHVVLAILFPARYFAFLTESHPRSPALLHIAGSPSTPADRADYAA